MVSSSRFPLLSGPPLKSMETYPGSLSQRRLWFLHQLQAPTSAYNVHVGLWLYGRLDLAALQSSLQEVVNRHETLRTTFVLDKTALVQRVRREQTQNAGCNQERATSILGRRCFQLFQKTEIVSAMAARQAEEFAFDFREIFERVTTRKFLRVHEKASSCCWTMARHCCRSGTVNCRPE